MLIATHVDQTRSTKGQHGEWISPDAQIVLENVQSMMPHFPNLMDTIVVMDCNVPASFPFKQVKSLLANIKQNCLQVSNSFLFATIAVHSYATS